MARWAVLASVALVLSLPVLGNSASHYEVLGLTPSATTEDVRRAYKKLARKFHPDKVRPHCVVQPAVQASQGLVQFPLRRALRPMRRSGSSRSAPLTRC